MVRVDGSEEMEAAAQVEETLKPRAAQLNGSAWTWASLIRDLKPKDPFPNTARLTAYALYDGTQLNDQGAQLLRDLLPNAKMPNAQPELLLVHQQRAH
jgi:hypothetical protein